MASYRPPLKRLSCQATYRAPLGAAEIWGRIEASRTGAPPFGSRVPTESSSATTLGAVQVRPLSNERTTAMRALSLPPTLSICTNRLTSAPSRCTTMTLPMVWLCGPGS